MADQTADPPQLWGETTNADRWRWPNHAVDRASAASSCTYRRSYTTLRRSTESKGVSRMTRHLTALIGVPPSPDFRGDLALVTAHGDIEPA